VKPFVVCCVNPAAAAAAAAAASAAATGKDEHLVKSLRELTVKPFVAQMVPSLLLGAQSS
jgi:hypothetical protein